MDKNIRRYYVAVSQKDAKLVTLMELLAALHDDDDNSENSGNGSGKLGTVVICCSSRDSLDTVIRGVSTVEQHFSVTVLHSDMTEKEREAELVRAKGRIDPNDFNLSSAGITGSPLFIDEQRIQSTEATHPETCASRSCSNNPPTILITTDPPLKAAPKELVPLGASLLIQYDLPLNKEVFLRRLAAAFGSGKERRSSAAAGRNTVIDFVTAAEIAAFRQSEDWSSALITEMPVHVADIFKSHTVGI